MSFQVFALTLKRACEDMCAIDPLVGRRSAPQAMLCLKDTLLQGIVPLPGYPFRGQGTCGVIQYAVVRVKRGMNRASTRREKCSSEELSMDETKGEAILPEEPQQNRNCS